MPDLSFVPRRRSGRNTVVLVCYLLFLLVLVLVHARVFQYLMTEYESDPDHSFIDGIYWTITTMTTLGFGDITFASHAGRLFSAWVTLSGFLFLLVLLPFGVISVVFGPWLQTVLRYRPRTRLKRTAKDHVIICGWDQVTGTLAKDLKAGNVAHVALSGDLQEVRRLEDARITALYGIPTDADTLRRARASTARMVIANMSDPDNANLVLTVRSLGETPVTSIVTRPERSELMTIAGADHVIPIRQTLGNYLAVRAITGAAFGHVIDSLGDLRFAEIPAHATPFVGQTVARTGIQQAPGILIIGIWEHGAFSLAKPDKVVEEGVILLLVGTDTALEKLRASTGTSRQQGSVLVLGYGTVGSASATFLRNTGVPHVVIDRSVEPDELEPELIRADASRHDILEKAGIREASGLIVTTNDDGMNVFLTLAARHLNPHIRISARANREANVTELYSAGADFVVSHSSVGASMLSNLILGRSNVFLAEGVHLFSRPVPTALHRQTLASSKIRTLTGATVVALQHGTDTLDIDLRADTVLDQNSTLIMVGTSESEALFAGRYGRRATGAS